MKRLRSTDPGSKKTALIKVKPERKYKFVLVNMRALKMLNILSLEEFNHATNKERNN